MVKCSSFVMQVVWLMVELCKLLEEKRSTMLRLRFLLGCIVSILKPRLPQAAYNTWSIFWLSKFVCVVRRKFEIPLVLFALGTVLQRSSTSSGFLRALDSRSIYVEKPSVFSKVTTSSWNFHLFCCCQLRLCFSFQNIAFGYFKLFTLAFYIHNGP